MLARSSNCPGRVVSAGDVLVARLMILLMIPKMLATRASRNWSKGIWLRMLGPGTWYSTV